MARVSLHHGHHRLADVVGATAEFEETAADGNRDQIVVDTPLTTHPAGEQSGTRSWQACFRRCHFVFTGSLTVACVFLAWVAYGKRDATRLRHEPGADWAPLPGKDTVLHRLAFGSCAQQQFAQPFWDAIAGVHPNIFIYAGDNVYGDCWPDNCSELLAAYERLRGKPSFAGAKRTLPMIAVWDDHDFGQNDGSASNPHKVTAKNMFLDFFEIVANDERRTRPGLYTSYMWGPPGQRVQVILLDTRWFRSSFSRCKACKGRYAPDTDSSKTMLGKDQWSWLQDQLLKVADIRLLVSTIQVVADGHAWEGWLMLPQERERLYALLAKSVGTTIILSGDRHVGGFYKSPAGVWEVTSSSLTHAQPLGLYGNCNSSESCDEVDHRRLGSFIRVNHFGTVDIDWTLREITLALNRAANADGHVRPGDLGLAGEVLRSYKVSFAKES